MAVSVVGLRIARLELVLESQAGQYDLGRDSRCQATACQRTGASPLAHDKGLVLCR